MACFKVDATVTCISLDPNRSVECSLNDHELISILIGMLFINSFRPLSSCDKRNRYLQICKWEQLYREFNCTDSMFMWLQGIEQKQTCRGMDIDECKCHNDTLCKCSIGASV